MRPITLHKQIELMLKLNVSLETTLTEHKDAFGLPGPVASEFTETAHAMCMILSQVAEHFVEASAETGIKLFDITSKAHAMIHSAMLCKYINPRVLWCFTGEDYMQKSQVLAQSCVRGNNGALAQVKMCHHTRLGMHLRFEAHND